MRRTRLVAALLVCTVIGFARVGSAQDAARPTILSVTMDAAGNLLTITGTGFGAAAVVTIDGQPVPVLAGATDTQVTVVTPAVLVTTPGTYRLMVVDSVRQVGEVFVVTSRAGLVPAISLTTSGTPSSSTVPEATTVRSRASGTAVASSSGNIGEPVGTFAIEDSGSPFRTALGFEALSANDNTFGLYNTATGYQALASHALLTGPTLGMSSFNTASGYQALASNTSGGNNTAIGSFALDSNTIGDNNTASGSGALSSNTGRGNTALGFLAGANATTGNENLFLGSGVGGTSDDTHTIRIGRPYTGLFGQNQTFIAGIRGTTVSGGFPVVIDANGQLGTAPGLTFANSGSLGIGTTAPDSLLHVTSANYPVVNIESTSINGGVLQLKSSINNWQAYNQTGDLRFSTNSAPAGDRVAITGAGNVGIGTVSPAALLDVNKSSIGATAVSIRNPTAGTGNYARVDIKTDAAGGRGLFDAYSSTFTSSGNSVQSGVSFTAIGAGGFSIALADPAAPMRFYTGAGPSERLRIDGNGNVGIGTTTPANPLQLASGAYVSAGGVWTNASSRTLKDQIADLSASRAQAAFERLKPVTFVYKADPTEAHVGFIAEDVPDLVATADRRSLAAMDIVAVLTKVAQEQQQQLHDQQTTINDLQARLARLESLLTDAAAGGK